jgi:pyruvate,water dikinase
VILDLGDADRLEPGDVLVTTMTSPPWTPLFGVAGAVVTDSGDVLSHVAIAAREYGIPCVVGTHHATRLIVDGDVVTVDGDAGTVTTPN